MATTKLGSKVTSGSFSDGFAQRISEEIAISNFRKLERTDSELTRMREIVYRYIQPWPTSEKQQLLMAYGDHEGASLGGRNLTRRLTEIMIATMDSSTFDGLYRQLNIREQMINQTLKISQTVSNQAAREMLQEAKEVSKESKLRKPNVTYRSKSGKDVKDRGKNIRETLPKNQRFLGVFPRRYVKLNVRNQRRLENELKNVLQLFNVRQLHLMFEQMNGDIDNIGSYTSKEVIEYIIDSTVLFVALETGSMKGKATQFTSYVANKDVYKEILGLTSYAFVVGITEPQLSPAELAERVAQVEENKKEMQRKMKEMNKTSKRARRVKTNFFGNLLRPLTNYRGYMTFEGFLTKDKYGQRIAQDAFDIDPVSGKPALNLTKLNAYAHRIGVTEEINGFNYKGIVVKLADLMEKQDKRQKRTDWFANILDRKFVPKWIRKRVRNKQEKEASITRLYTSGGSVDSIGDGTEGTLSIPTITRTDIQELTDKINTALPVYILNDIWTRKQRTEKIKERAKKDSEIADTSENYNDFIDTYLKILDKVGNKNESMELTKAYMFMKDNKRYDDAKTRQEENEVLKNTLIYLSPNRETDMIDLISKRSLDLGDIDNDFENLKPKDKKKRKPWGSAMRRISGFTDHIEPELLSYLKAKHFSSKNITPVYITNKKTHVTDPTDKDDFVQVKDIVFAEFNKTRLDERKEGSRITLGDINDDSASKFDLHTLKDKFVRPVYVVNKELKTKSDGAEKINEALEMAKLLVSGQYLTIAAILADKSITKMATGGSGSAIKTSLSGMSGAKQSLMGTPISQFIAGDSLNTSPNPEMITVDWDQKRFDVEPLSQEKSGNITNIKRLSPSERSRALSASITSPLIKYGRSLQDSDDGDKTALKVYSVNPGITDLVDLGGGEQASLIGLVANMTMRLENIERLIGVGNQISGAIAESSAGAVTALNRQNKHRRETGLNADLSSILRGEG